MSPRGQCPYVCLWKRLLKRGICPVLQMRAQKKVHPAKWICLQMGFITSLEDISYLTVCVPNRRTQGQERPYIPKRVKAQRASHTACHTSLSPAVAGRNAVS